MLCSLKLPRFRKRPLERADGCRLGVSHPRGLLLPLAVFLALGWACGGDGDGPVEYVYVQPALTGDGWETASLSEVGIDEARVGQAVEGILNQVYQQVHALLIIRYGRLVLEEYFDGNNRAHVYIRYDVNTLHDLASATKSVTSILTGLAIQNGFIRGAQDPALSYLPEYEHLSTPQKERITIEHLLTMTAGWEWSESTVSAPENDMYLFNMHRDPLAFLIAKEMVAEPGEVWCYNGGAVTLLGKIIERASGLDLETFSDLYLFAPMGITDFDWPYINPDLIAAHGDLDLRPRDMAKIGQMMLSRGVWDRRRILAEGWVDASWVERFRFPPSWDRDGYGYLWWLATYAAEGRAVSSVSARGWGGQQIIVLPELQTIVVFTGGNYDPPEEPVDTIMERFIVPAIAP